MPIAKITIGTVTLDCETLDTPTARAILAALPFTTTVNTWGDEVYFSTPLNLERETDARELMQLGDIAFWTEGNSIAIGYGETPISAPGEIRLAAKVNVWARALGDVTVLASAETGDVVEVKLGPK